MEQLSSSRKLYYYIMIVKYIIHLANNYVFYVGTKQVDVKYHKIEEWISLGELLLSKIHTKENAIYILTKYS